ncbi:hypothetical protein GCM10023148_04800 [Actinokineospora soli]
MSGPIDGYMSTSEAAKVLKVSTGRVRDLIAEGKLAAAKVERELLVKASDVHHRREVVRPGPGAPLSPRIAWAMLLAASDFPVDWVSSAEMVRVRRHMRRPLRAWPRLLTRRAERRRVRFLPGTLQKARQWPGAAVGGLEAAIAHGADLVAPERTPVDLYLSEEAFERASRTRGIDWESRSPNAALMVLPPLAASAVDDIVGTTHVPRAVAAADLLDLGDERSWHAAADLLGRERTDL